jgi:hydroxymethylpyrimidine pyrophosphatase-like HAD family hydrolase
MKPKTILAFDIDGTLTPRNSLSIRPKSLVPLLDFLEKLGHVPLLVTGKPIAYATQVLEESELPPWGIIAENAGVYQVAGGQPQVFGPGEKSVKKLKQLLGLEEDKGGVTKIKLADVAYEVVIDPGDISILTIFTNPKPVAHRWQFSHEIEVDYLYEKLEQIITKNNLQHELHLLPPFPDEALQVIRKDASSGTHIDKSKLTQVASLMFDVPADLPKAMFGDGHNDIPAMLAEGVVPMTFSNAEESVKQVVKAEGGYISEYKAVNGLGIVDGIRWLATEKNFFGDDSGSVIKYVEQLINES